jgi:DNA-binding NarL/FixJ family response regulator
MGTLDQCHLIPAPVHITRLDYMISDQIAKISRYKKQLASLEKNVAAILSRELAALPRKYGFGSVQEFVKAVKSASRGGFRKAAKTSTNKTRKRAKITPEIKQKVKAMVGAGQTGGQIAKKVGISLPSVQNIKKELGLVKARK